MAELFDKNIFDEGIFDKGIVIDAVFDGAIFDSNIFDTGIELPPHGDINSELPRYQTEIICSSDRIIKEPRGKNTSGNLMGKPWKAPDRYTKELDRMLRQEDDMLIMLAKSFTEIIG